MVATKSIVAFMSAVFLVSALVSNKEDECELDKSPPADRPVLEKGCLVLFENERWTQGWICPGSEVTFFLKSRHWDSHDKCHAAAHDCLAMGVKLNANYARFKRRRGTRAVCQSGYYAPAEKKKPGYKKPGYEKPVDKQPTDEKPTDEKPTDEKPTDEKPTDEKPTDEKPTDKEPVEEPVDDYPGSED